MGAERKAIEFLLSNVVRTGDAQSSAKAQEHLDALSEEEPRKTLGRFSGQDLKTVAGSPGGQDPSSDKSKK